MKYKAHILRSLPIRTVATATLVALLAWATGLSLWLSTAQAANVEEMYDLLSDSDVGADAQHDIFFITQNPMNGDESFRIYIDEAGSLFDFSLVTDTDLIASSTGFTAVNTCGAGSDEIDLSVGANYIEGTVCTGDTVPAGLIGIQIGDAEFLNNPATPGSYIVSLQGSGATPIADSGDTRIAIIDSVTVTAQVDTIFTFSINGVDAGVTVNTEGATTGTSTATSVPFGVIAPTVPKVMAQELRVSTNAFNGFAVTVEADETLTAGNGATIDTFVNGLNTATPQGWTSPAGLLANDLSWGHWGLTSDDAALVAGDTFGDALYIGDFVGNPKEVFYYDGPVTYSQGGMGVGSTTVAYKVEITTLQEAANDYTATLTYIATPVF
jgi:hypothetical protein